MNATATTCARCEAALIQQRCGCWIDPTHHTRWCIGGRELHQPDGSTQPEHCPGSAWTREDA